VGGDVWEWVQNGKLEERLKTGKIFSLKIAYSWGWMIVS
jgi:hypothetical protein